MSDALLSRAQNLFWTSFIAFLFFPLIGSILSPLPFALFVPATGFVFFLAHKFIFKSWPWLKMPVRGLLPLFASLFVLMALSSVWSVNPEASFERALKVSGLMIASFSLLAVAQSCPPLIFKKYSVIFPGAVIMVGLITSLDIYFGMPLYDLINGPFYGDQLRPDLVNKNSSVFVMAFPVALYLSLKSRSILLFALLLLLGIAIFFLTYSQACQLSLLVIFLASFGCLFFLEKLTIRTAFAGIAAVIIILPWIAPTLFDLLATKVSEQNTGVLADASAALRLENWDFLARRILENPLTGFGLDSTRYMTFDTEQLYFKNDSIMHPHNMGLQLWIEFGIFGVAWALAFMAYLYVFFMRLPANIRRLSFITLCGVTVFLLVSWSIWASWLLALIFYLATLCVLAAKTNNDLSNS